MKVKSLTPKEVGNFGFGRPPGRGSEYLTQVPPSTSNLMPQAERSDRGAGGPNLYKRWEGRQLVLQALHPVPAGVELAHSYVALARHPPPLPSS